MKKLINIIVLFVLVSCSVSSNKNSNKELKEEPMADLILVEDSVLENTESKISEDGECIFNQLTQTDEFLKGIGELSTYEWDSIEKVATIILESNDTLLIKRGGCNFYSVSADFILRHDTLDYSQWENVFNKVLWISGLLSSDFAYKELKNEIDSSSIKINGDYVYFSNEYLQDNNYELYRTIEKEKTSIVLSHYIY
ncbi:hypothetical protein [Plebeiibacterium sediminum]|uniref:Lipoprotein n=1 Tax=Plebeiibacterium sediminum TaxID=2992112 RepID=A0AAE3M379_9BACT|nr:hypothetical protein [Plebeiobacterium sediminum]MCW3786299.1 hypothetical protein [Plebeiobacterium sediminum]